jgi:hypothetical protein
MSRTPKRVQVKSETIATDQDYLSVVESAKFLQISVRQFRKYVAKGYFHAVTVGKGHYYKRGELISLRDKREPTIEFSPKSFEVLLSRVNRLSDKVEMLERILDLRYEPLQLEILQLHSLYLSAKGRQIDIKTKTIQYWGEVLVRLTDQHFLELYNFTKNKNCWRVFLEMAYICYGIAKLREMWSLRKLLHMAYKNIKQSTIIYLELLGQKPVPNLIKPSKLKLELKEIKSKLGLNKLLKPRDLPVEGIEREPM